MIDPQDYRIDVFPEYHDGKLIGYVSYFPPLDLYSQGTTPEEAEEAMRTTIKSWAIITSDRVRTETKPARHYATVIVDGQKMIAPCSNGDHQA